MATGLFRPAQRRKAKLRLGIDGPSGSGKTFSALEIAYGLTHDWSKIALIDTEHGSGDLYADKGPYAVLTFDPQHKVERYITAIHAAEKEGFEVIIIDSLTHAWAGTGGLLDQHDIATRASNSGNSYVAWREVTPLHNDLIDTMLQSSCHVIATLRTKVDYVQEEDENGRKRVRKVGTKPIQREGMDYEFTIVFDIDRDHVATASKTRVSEFDAWIGIPDQGVGEQLLAWLEQGVDAPAPESALPTPTEPPAPAAGNGKPKTISREQIRQLETIIVVDKGREVADVVASLNRHGICPGGLETIPLESFESVASTLTGLKVKEAPTSQETAPPAPAAPVAEPVAVPAPAAPKVAQPSAQAPEAPTAPQGVNADGLPNDDFVNADGELALPEPEKEAGTAAPKQLQQLGIICQTLEDNGVMWRAIPPMAGKKSRKELSFEEAQTLIRVLRPMAKAYETVAKAS